MISMQYKVTFPHGFGMDCIRKEITDNKHKTDRCPGLLFKAYLIREKSDNVARNEYSPLYIWTGKSGMNTFISGGISDCIFRYFGWQDIYIGLPTCIELKQNFETSTHVLEIECDVTENGKENSEPPIFQFATSGKVKILNASNSKYIEFYFFENPDKSSLPIDGRLYEILHILM